MARHRLGASACICLEDKTKNGNAAIYLLSLWMAIGNNFHENQMVKYQFLLK